MSAGEPHLPDLAPHLSIGEVLEQLRDEFPDVTISKIRFLESQGLIDPERTPSGYRKFSSGDLDRLRWILLQQRDHFLPLKVIKERLDAFGAAGAPPHEAARPSGTGGAPRSSPSSAASVGGAGARGASGSARTPSPPLPFEDALHERDDEAEALGDLTPPEKPDVRPRADDELTRAELLEASGLNDAQLDELEDHGLLGPVVGAGERALYDEQALELAELAAGFHARGIEARHLKMYKHFSEREAALFAQVLLPYLRQRNPDARAKLEQELSELTRLGRRLRTATLRQALRDELRE